MNENIDILQLIKNKRATREYLNHPISQDIIDKIIEAGIWGPSIHGIQPWCFIPVVNKLIIHNIADSMKQTKKRLGAGANIIMHSTAETISRAPALIAVYNSGEFGNLAKRFREDYLNVAGISETIAIAAAMQNMVLVAESLGIGTCFITMVLFCEEEISRILNTQKQLVAIITLGYPDRKIERSQRKIS